MRDREVEEAVLGLLTISGALAWSKAFKGSIELIDWLIAHVLVKYEEFQNEG